MTYYTCKWNGGEKCINAYSLDMCRSEYVDGLSNTIDVRRVTTCCRQDKRKTPEAKTYLLIESDMYMLGMQAKRPLQAFGKDCNVLTVEFCKQFIADNS